MTSTARAVLRCTPPFDARGLLEFLGPRAVAGVEHVEGGVYRRVAAVDGHAVVVELRPTAAGEAVVLEAPRSVALDGLAVATRRLLDLDADPASVMDVLGRDPLLGPMVARRPGLRVPGAWAPWEAVVRAVLGQQVSVAAATTLAGRLAARAGIPLSSPVGPLRHTFPDALAVASADLDGLGITGGRVRALRALAERVMDGRLVLDPGTDPAAIREKLLTVPGVGPWTADYVALRALGDRDAFPAGDLGLRRRLADVDGCGNAAGLRARAEAWRPFRAYATLYLWTDDAEESRA